MLRSITVTALLLASIPGPAAADPAAAITADDLLADVAAFTAPAAAGRLPGTPGYALASAHAESVLSALGLEPGGDDGAWRQHLPIEANLIERCAVRLTGADGRAADLAVGDDCACRGFSGGGRAESGVVFVGYGLSLPERGYDDYAGIDVTGKVVLAFKQAPGWQPDDGAGWQGADMPRPKAAAARAHGAAALLLVSRPNDARPQPVIASVMHGDGEHVPDLPAVQVSVEQAARLFSGGLDDLKAAQAAIDEARRPSSRPLAGRALVDVAARHETAADGWNLVAVLPGSDPDLAGEAVIIGGHLDHVGRQAGVAWPGANDNASGAAGVLGVARAFAAEAAAGRPPRRTVVFVLFTGEEQGLIGARFHAAHPVLPLDRTAAMLNLDCVAHGDSIQLGGGRTQPVLWQMARGLDAANDALSVAATWPGGGADAQPFWDGGVPTVYFASKFSYTHLHRASDTVDTLNPGLYEALVRLAWRTASAVADGRYQREEIAAAE